MTNKRYRQRRDEQDIRSQQETSHLQFYHL
jgi:hypothetical protein